MFPISSRTGLPSKPRLQRLLTTSTYSYARMHVWAARGVVGVCERVRACASVCECVCECYSQLPKCCWNLDNIIATGKKPARQTVAGAARSLGEENSGFEVLISLVVDETDVPRAWELFKSRSAGGILTLSPPVIRPDRPSVLDGKQTTRTCKSGEQVFSSASLLWLLYICSLLKLWYWFYFYLQNKNYTIYI